MNGMDGRQRLFLGVMLIIAFALVFLFVADGIAAASILGLILLAALWITKSVWSPDDTQTTKVATASLTVIGAIAAGYFKLTSKTRQDLIGTIPPLAGISSGQTDLGVLALLFLCLITNALINFYFTR
jgi:hypothetical protein